jgi:hypothetical protein
MQTPLPVLYAAMPAAAEPVPFMPVDVSDTGGTAFFVGENRKNTGKKEKSSPENKKFSREEKKYSPVIWRISCIAVLYSIIINH